MTDYSELALVRAMNYLADKQAAIANNLANVDSTGYKRRVSQAMPGATQFSDMLQDELQTISYAEATDWTTGSLTPTANKLHVALEGPGFLMVENTAGRQFYTRDGNMHLDVQGKLVNGHGDRFLDIDGRPISLANGDRLPSDSVQIAVDGSVSAEGEQLGQIGVFSVADTARLRPAGAGRFIDGSGQRAVRDSAARLRQGNLERSNVNALTEMVNMIEVQRTFQGSGRALTIVGRMKTGFINAMNR